jgi:hypothetical protein
MNDFSFMRFCKEVNRKRWFKKNWLWLDLPLSNYSFMKEEYSFKKNNILYQGILYCTWYDKKETYDAVILDSQTLEKMATVVPERSCKSFNKVYLLTQLCFKYEINS